MGSLKTVLTYGLFVMTLTHTLAHAFQGMHTTIFPLLKQEFGLGYYELGLIAAIPPLCAALLSIPAGMLSDRFGTKKMIIVSMILSCAGSITAGLSQNPWMFIAAVSLLYLNTTFYHPPSYSYVSSAFKAGDRSKALGFHGAGGTLGMAIGPVSIGLLTASFAFGWRQVYLFWFIPLLLGLAMVLLIKDEAMGAPAPAKQETPGRDEPKSVVSSSMIWFLTFNGVRAMAAGVSSAFLSLYLVSSQGWSLQNASYIFGLSSGMGIIAAPIGGFLADRFGEKKWTLICFSVSSLCYAASFFMPGAALFTVFYMGYGFFQTMSMASNSSLTAKLSPSNQRGLGFALYFLPGSIMGAVAPMLAAYVASTYGLFPVFMLASAIFIVSLPLLQFGVKVD